jgi:hypothetical protein
MGINDTILDCGGLKRRLKVMRLPEVNSHRELFGEIEIDLSGSGDNQLWVCVTTEDGFQAWSSPIFVFN